jgi:hypothetical protein
MIYRVTTPTRERLGYLVGFCAVRSPLPLTGVLFGNLSFFGFFGSRPLRFCPLAMIALPFRLGVQ